MSHLLLDVVAADKLGEVHVLTDGMTAVEQCKEAAVQGSGRVAQAVREQCFPIETLEEGLRVTIVKASASSSRDRHHILNVVAGQSLGEPLDLENSIYNMVDRRLRAKFARIAMRAAVQHTPGLDLSDDGNFQLSKAIREDPQM